MNMGRLACILLTVKADGPYCDDYLCAQSHPYPRFS